MISKNQSKFIKSLNIKKYRDIENAFIVEGKKNVLELLRSNLRIQSIVCTPSFNTTHKTELDGEFEVHETSEEQLSRLGSFKANKDCLAVVEKPENDLRKLDLTGINFLLDDISDPGNLGTIIRTLDWFGFTQLICSEHTADLFNPKAINATMGSFLRIKVYYTDLRNLIDKAKTPVFGTDIDGRPLDGFSFPKNCLIIMGSESNGLSDRLTPKITEKISIQGCGNAESLNVAIATGIVCYSLRNS